MRGSPLLRAALAFFVILSLGYPLWRMTGSEPAFNLPAASPAPVESGLQKIHLQLTFTLPPRGFKVLHLGKEIWSESAPAQDIEKDLTLPYPKEGIDLRFQVDWPADAPFAAVRVKLADPAGETHEKSIWEKGPADEVLTFP
jgi:hypothetical protein